jgi:hypothetical protein
MVVATVDYTAMSLVIAIVGLVLSVMSLTWQATMFVLSGSRIKALLQHGAIGRGSLVVSKPGTQSMEYLANQGFTDEVLAIKVRNVGRLSVSVTSVAAVFGSGISIGQLDHPRDRALPYRLEAQSEQTWFVSMDAVRAAAESWLATRPKGSSVTRGQLTVQMSVGLGNGKLVKTKESISIAPARLTSGK